MRFLVILLLVSSFDVSSQSENHSYIGTTVQYNPLDLFFTVNFSRQVQRLEFKVDLGIGLNRTIFQRRLFPILGFSGSFFFLHKSKLQFGPSILFQSGLLKVNNQTDYFNYYNQISGGYSFSYGRRLIIFQSTFYGVNFDSFFSTFSGKYKTVNGLKLASLIGLKYAL